MPFPVRVSDVMTSPVETATPTISVGEAAARVTREDIGSLVVVDDDEPVGIVTHTDLVALLGEATDPHSHRLADIMSSPLRTTTPETPVRDAVDAMADHGVSRLAVINAGELVGIVSTDDVVRFVPQVFHRHLIATRSPGEPQYRARRETAYEDEDWTFEATTRTDAGVSVGDRVEFSKRLTEQDVQSFAGASGDTNRLHLDETFAARTRFQRRIVHGTLVSGVISAALARLPGLTIYISQDLSFLAPVAIGDRVTAVCEVVEDRGHHKYTLTTDVFRSDGDLVIEGEAAVLIDDPPIPGDVSFEPIETVDSS